MKSLEGTEQYTNHLIGIARHLKSVQRSEFQELVVPASIIEAIMGNPTIHAKMFGLVSQFQQHASKKIAKQLYGSMKEDSYQYSLATSRLKVQIQSIPHSIAIHRPIRTLNEYDNGKWVVIQGTVVRASQRKLLQKSKLFRCLKCGNAMRLTSNYHNSYVFEIPQKCVSNPVGKASKKTSKDKCRGKKFEAVDEQRVFIDYQEIKLQEQFHNRGSGMSPQSIIVLLQGQSLVDMARAGDTVSVSGRVCARFTTGFKDRLYEGDLVVMANKIVSGKRAMQIELKEEDKALSQLTISMKEYQLCSQEQRITKQIKFRHDVIQMFCSQIYGQELVKLGILLCVLGGTSYVKYHSRIRGNSHMLIIGQPGTGKSVMLTAASELIPHSLFINAVCSTSAGITVAHVKQKGHWALQPGALVLCDNGVCCIDQFTHISTKDQPCFLEAMEQQTISSAKAGVIGKLNCRVGVIAACNPDQPGQKINKLIPLPENTNLGAPLLSRFDLIIPLQNNDSVEEDLKKANHMLGRFHEGKANIYKRRRQVNKLKALIRKARKIQPDLKQAELLQNYFIQIRKDTKSTVRALESLCRLAQAHSKLLMRDQTTLFDCVSAIMLMDGQYSMEYSKFMEAKQFLQSCGKE